MSAPEGFKYYTDEELDYLDARGIDRDTFRRWLVYLENEFSNAAAAGWWNLREKSRAADWTYIDEVNEP